MVLRAAERLLLCALLLGVAGPGLLLWMPPRVLIKRRERTLLAKGPNWNDSVAEMKMLLGTLGVGAIVLASASLASRCWPERYSSPRRTRAPSAAP